jgi:hypothetical protein
VLILIVKDTATQVPREVKDLAEAQLFADQGHHVLVQNEDGSKTPLADVIFIEQHRSDVLEAAEMSLGEPPADPPKPVGLVAKVKAAVTRKKK